MVGAVLWGNWIYYICFLAPSPLEAGARFIDRQTPEAMDIRYMESQVIMNRRLRCAAHALSIAMYLSTAPACRVSSASRSNGTEYRMEHADNWLCALQTTKTLFLLPCHPIPSSYSRTRLIYRCIYTYNAPIAPHYYTIHLNPRTCTARQAQSPFVSPVPVCQPRLAPARLRRRPTDAREVWNRDAMREADVNCNLPLRCT